MCMNKRRMKPRLTLQSCSICPVETKLDVKGTKMRRRRKETAPALSAEMKAELLFIPNNYSNKTLLQSTVLVLSAAQSQKRKIIKTNHYVSNYITFLGKALVGLKRRMYQWC